MCFAPQQRALLNISTSKSVPRLRCFVHFEFEMRFTLQRRALFRHLNFRASRHNAVHFFGISTSKCGPNMVCFVHFDLQMRFAPRTACTFSTSQLLKVLQSWGALCILISTCASRRNGVQFFISHLPRRLRTRRFSEPTFRPSGATNHWKNMENIVFRDFATFSAHLHLLSSDFLFSLLFSSLLRTLPTSAFPSVHIVGSLTSI